ncbi:hypothetical protein BDF21DRAFT_429032 [Thamnidium elegans]|uniref:PH domain-containing protein n=1 Tax=Thamnidium elegans TaxID=101142 RepID=A0A8H7SKZ6_9FUNG|nr:hypothetical protein INT48_001525 [Thamnidium elegans]KAI8062057.1 hypothetical protein BDF21DRAFT_429032 [Thamnidium elegans]
MKNLSNSLYITSPMSIPFPVDEMRVRQPKNTGQFDMNDPSSYKPRANGVNVGLILQQAIHSGWMTKHRTPTFSFMKNSKPRLVVLVDRMLYTFKSNTPETYREFYELTANTNAYVTDQISGVLFCIEIKKKGQEEAWYLQAEDAESMKVWLDRIKRTISCVRASNNNTDTITNASLLNITTEEEEYTMATNNKLYESPVSSKSELSLDTILFHSHNSQPSSPVSSIIYENESVSSFQSSIGAISDYSLECPRRKSSQRVSRPSISYSLSTVPPPQLPPPKTQPPPIPSYAYL